MQRMYANNYKYFYELPKRSVALVVKYERDETVLDNAASGLQFERFAISLSPIQLEMLPFLATSPANYPLLSQRYSILRLISYRCFVQLAIAPSDLT